MKKVWFCFFLLVFLKAIVAFQFPSPWVMGDEAIYTAKTRAILQGNFNFDEFHYGGPRVPPLYSMFLVPAYLFDDPLVNYRISLLINILLSSSIIFPAYFIAKRFLSEIQALLGAILVSLYPSLTGYSFIIMSENLFIPLFLFSLFFFLRTLERNQWHDHVLLGLTLGALAITRVIGIFPILTWGLFQVFSLFKSSKKWEFFKNIAITFIFLLIPIVFWSLVKEGSTLQSTGGYELSKYLEAVKTIITQQGAFLKAFRLSLSELAYTFASSFFLFIPLFVLGLFLRIFESDKGRFYRFLGLFVITNFLFFFGTSIVHQFLFSQKDPTRYLVFGRYIDPLLPALLLFGCIAFFQFVGTQLKWRRVTAFLLIFLTFLFTFRFLPNSTFDLVNNFPLFIFRNTDFLENPPIPWLLLFFFIAVTFASPTERLKKTFVSLCVVFAIAVMISPILIMHAASRERAENLGAYEWIVNNVSKHEIIGFDREGLWEKNTIHLFWLYEFWFSKNYHLKITSPEDSVEYFISYRDLPYPKVYQDEVHNVYVR